MTVGPPPVVAIPGRVAVVDLNDDGVEVYAEVMLADCRTGSTDSANLVVRSGYV